MNMKFLVLTSLVYFILAGCQSEKIEVSKKKERSFGNVGNFDF